MPHAILTIRTDFDANVLASRAFYISGQKLQILPYISKKDRIQERTQMASRRIFLESLPMSMSEAKIEQAFKMRDQQVSKVELKTHFSKQEKFAFVTFETKSAANKVLEIGLIEIDGLVIKLNPIDISKLRNESQDIPAVNGTEDVGSYSPELFNLKSLEAASPKLLPRVPQGHYFIGRRGLQKKLRDYDADWLGEYKIAESTKVSKLLKLSYDTSLNHLDANNIRVSKVISS